MKKIKIKFTKDDRGNWCEPSTKNVVEKLNEIVEWINQQEKTKADAREIIKGRKKSGKWSNTVWHRRDKK